MILSFSCSENVMLCSSPFHPSASLDAKLFVSGAPTPRGQLWRFLASHSWHSLTILFQQRDNLVTVLLTPDHISMSPVSYLSLHAFLSSSPPSLFPSTHSRRCPSSLFASPLQIINSRTFLFPAARSSFIGGPPAPLPFPCLPPSLNDSPSSLEMPSSLSEGMAISPPFFDAKEPGPKEQSRSEQIGRAHV